MTNSKSITFTVLFLAALGGAGYILYNKQNTPVASAPASTQEIKGAETTVSPASPEAPASGEYTKKNSLLHLALTRENIIWYTNYERSINGLKPLATSDALEASSHAKGLDMFQYQYFDHTRKGANDAVGFDSFIDNQNYSFIKIGENLAMGDFSTSAEVVNAWMKSPAHRKNILDPLYHEIGASVTSGTMEGKSTSVFVQHFGDPRASCPTIDESTKEAIGALKGRIASLQSDINEEQDRVNSSSATFDPQFDTIIGDYNTLVNTYNDSIKQMGTLVGLYNAQVRKFDQCIQLGS